MFTRHSHFSSPFMRRLWLAGVLICGLLLSYSLFVADQSPSGTFLATRVWAAGSEGSAKKEPGGAKTAARDKTSSATLTIFPRNSMDALAQALQTRQRELIEREESVKKSEQRLEALRKETEQNLAKIDARLKEMKTITARAEGQRKEEMSIWVNIYQEMSPKDAGRVIQDLEPSMASQVLSQMDPKKAGKILKFVAPDKAVKLNKKLPDKSL